MYQTTRQTGRAVQPSGEDTEPKPKSTSQLVFASIYGMAAVLPSAFVLIVFINLQAARSANEAFLALAATVFGPACLIFVAWAFFRGWSWAPYAAVVLPLIPLVCLEPSRANSKHFLHPVASLQVYYLPAAAVLGVVAALLARRRSA